MLLKAKLYGQDVGVLSSRDGALFFQYFDSFIKSGLEISPFYLPLSPRVYSGREFLPTDMIPGVFYDSLPDSFGSTLMAHFFQKHHGSLDAMRDPLRKLSFMADRAIGAIEYEPVMVENDADRITFELREYIKEVRKIIEGNSSDVVKELTAHPSPGGARPKAFVNWNREQDRMTTAESESGEEQWIVKFYERAPDKANLTKIEYLYFQIAKRLGLDIPEFDYICEGDEFHFAIKRFDRVVGEKRHLHTLGSLLNRRFDERGLVKYEDLFNATLKLTGNMRDVQEAFRRMLFNIVGNNCDDHAKNFSFVMDTKGRWRLSPTYDLTYSYGEGVYKEHFLTLAGKRSDFSKEDVIQTASKYDISQQSVLQMIEETNEAFCAFEELAKALELDTEGISISFIR